MIQLPISLKTLLYFCEEISTEELNIDKQSMVIAIAHFSKDSPMLYNFGNPFFYVIRKDETVKQIKKRLRERFNISKEDMDKWKAAIVSYTRPDYLKDSEVVAKKIESNDYLGFEHTDTGGRSSSNSLYRRTEKAISIKG